MGAGAGGGETRVGREKERQWHSMSGRGERGWMDGGKGGGGGRLRER